MDPIETYRQSSPTTKTRRAANAISEAMTVPWNFCGSGPTAAMSALTNLGGTRSKCECRCGRSDEYPCGWRRGHLTSQSRKSVRRRQRPLSCPLGQPECRYSLVDNIDNVVKVWCFHMMRGRNRREMESATSVAKTRSRMQSGIWRHVGGVMARSSQAAKCILPIDPCENSLLYVSMPMPYTLNAQPFPKSYFPCREEPESLMHRSGGGGTRSSKRRSKHPGTRQQESPLVLSRSNLWRTDRGRSWGCRRGTRIRSGLAATVKEQAQPRRG